MPNVFDFGANHSARRPVEAPTNTLTKSRTLKIYELAIKSKQISRYSMKRSSPLSVSYGCLLECNARQPPVGI